MRPPWMARVLKMQEHFSASRKTCDEAFREQSSLLHSRPLQQQGGRCPPYKFLSGLVANYSVFRNANACSRVSPHILCTGLKPIHTCGRSGFPKIRQLFSSLNCTQRTPAGLPLGIPGMGDEIDGAIQQAPQPRRQLNIGNMIFNQAKIYADSVRFYWAMSAFSATIPAMIWQSFHARTRSIA